MQLLGLDVERHTHPSEKGVTADSACQSNNHAVRWKELPAELGDRVVSGYETNSATLKVLNAL